MNHSLGSFNTRQLVLAAGQTQLFETDADQLLCLELDNAASITLHLNHGGAGELFKGLEVRGEIRHVRLTNDTAEAVTVKLALVNGLQLQDRRLNQVGDLGLVTAYATFLPLGSITIPGSSTRQLTTADPDRRYTMVSNPPGQFREVYISGAEFGIPTTGFANGDFELGNTSGWTVITGTWSAIAGAAHDGAFGVRMSTTAAGRILRQSVDLVSRGFATADIDAGGLVAKLSGWGRRNSGIAGNDLEIKVEFRDAAQALISTLTSGTLTPTAGVWTFVDLEGAIPALTRHLRVDLVAGASSPGTDFDTIALSVDGVPAGADTLAGFIMPAESRLLPTSGALYGFNPHATAQDVLLGEIKAT